VSKQLKYFDPETLARIRPFQLRARALVEGLVTGLHKSPLRGQSIEFAEHREYTAGDDLRQVDWKVYGRSDRFYLKQYEDETNLVCYILLDQSRSMLYQGEDSSLSKLEYAQLLAFSIAHLVVAQQDSAGLVTFGDRIEHWLNPASSSGQLDSMIQVMEMESGAERTDLQSVLNEIGSRISKPGLIFILSDLLDVESNILQSIRMMRHAGHDVVAVQVLDRDEVTFPFDQSAHFEALESADSLTVDPYMISKAYRQALQNYVERLRAGCSQVNAEHYLVQTNRSLAEFLPQLLSTRQLRRA